MEANNAERIIVTRNGALFCSNVYRELYPAKITKLSQRYANLITVWVEGDLLRPCANLTTLRIEDNLLRLHANLGTVHVEDNLLRNGAAIPINRTHYKWGIL